MSEAAALRIEVPKLEELIFIASSIHASIVNLDEERRLAFVFLVPIASLTPIIYYCKLDKLPDGRYAHFNRITGKIRFSNELSTEPNEVSILLARVKSQKLIP